jgi:hypothetical protein
MPLFGYNLQVLNPANADAGGLGIVTGNTQSTVTFSGFPVSSYLIHQYNGGLSQDSAVFPFTWTAPTTNAPDSVTFWFCGIAANNNGVNGNGDYSINGFQLAKKASTAGLNTTSSQQTLDLIAAQQRNDELIVHFNTEAFHTYTLHFTDLNGRELFSSTENSISENRQTVTIPIGMIQHNGIYMVYLTRDHAFFASQKIYVR